MFPRGLTFEFDPYAVLGLVRGASADEVREAFHRQSKKYHPDHGGDEWAFHIVARAYETLSQGAGGAVLAETGSARPEGASETVRVRPGVLDKQYPPEKLVEVELLWVRFEVENLLELIGAARREDRSLSASLNIAWPEKALAERGRRIAGDQAILHALSQAFGQVRARSPVIASQAVCESGRFEGWLSYASGQQAWAAFKSLHEALNARGLGVRQWTRDMLVSRGRR